MMAAPDVDNTDTGVLSLFNGQLHSFFGDNHTQVVIAVHHSQRGGVLYHRNFAVGFNAAAADAVQIVRYPEKAMGEHATHFCLQQHISHNAGILGRNACCFKQPAVSGFQFLNVYFHIRSSNLV